MVKLRTKKPDARLKRILAVLKEYSEAHSKANIEAYRHGSVSVRIRIIDPSFKDQSRLQREEELWALLEKLPEDVVAEISVLLLLTPEEAKKSVGSFDFDNPIPSRL